MEDQNKKITFQNINNGGPGEDFYTTFKEKLENVEKFPGNYSFKFIVDNSSAKIEQLKALFPDLPVKLTESKNSKYVSVTITRLVQNADEVIAYYKKAAVVEGVMML